MKRTRNQQSGFTLLELMVVVTLISVLAAIALPSFTSEARKSKGDSEVAAFFGELAVREEQYALENGKYLSTSTGESVPFPVTPTAAAQTLGTLTTTWQTHTARPPESSARCGYVVIAGTKTDSAGTIATSFGFTPPQKNWFYILAHCDLDGNTAVDSYSFISNDDAVMKKSNYGR